MIKITKDSILEQIKEMDKATFTVEDISKKAEWNYFLVSTIVKELVAEEILKEVSLNTYSFKKITLNKKPILDEDGEERELLKGELSMHSSGYGFINCKDGNKYFVPPNKVNFGMDGDYVKFYLQEDEVKGGSIACVESTLSRKSEYLVGLVKEDRRNYNVFNFIPDSGSVNYKIVIKNKEKLVKDHKIVLRVLQITSNKELFCEVYKDLGHIADKYVDIMSIVYAKSIPVDFSPESLEYCHNLKFNEEDTKDRVDLTKKFVVTIDGNDSKDFDDAICVEKLKNDKWKVYVSIADVSHYVKEYTKLDYEALMRGTSVYLIDVVVPMLPTELSNDLCSLNEHTQKLTITTEMIIDAEGNVEDYKIYKSFINSKHRLTYAEVNNYFVDKVVPKEDAELAAMLDEAFNCYKVLEANKDAKGMINFETEEAKLKLDEEGRTIGVHFYERKDAEKLIEQFMIIANETVAKFLASTKGITPLFRIHQPPQDKKIETFVKLGKLFGFTKEEDSKEITNKYIQNIINTNKGSEQSHLINLSLLKSLEKAKYWYKNEGHFGLASECYTHFTSPIRRYPDLIVHRLLTLILDNKIVDNFSASIPTMEEICEESNDSEIRAVECEREVIRIKKAEYMQQYVGQEFTGIISTTNKFGFFVEIHDSLEGLVHVSTLSDDKYMFNNDTLALVGENTKREFKIGDKVEIIVSNVVKFQGKVDFILKEFKDTQRERRSFDRGGRGGDRGGRPSFNRDRGDRPSFNRDRGDRPSFNRDRGDRPSFNRDRGDRPSFSRDRGDRPSFSRDGGDRPSFNRDRGDRPSFNRDRGDRPSFSRDGGDRPSFNRDRGDRPSFNRDRGDRPSFNRDRGDRPSFNRDRGDRPSFSRDGGDRPSFNRDRGDRPSFNRDRGDRPSFNRDRGDRPSFSRDGDDRPKRNFEDRPKRDFSDKKRSYGKGEFSGDRRGPKREGSWGEKKENKFKKD